MPLTAGALAAADRLLQSKEAVCAIARRRGLAATFVPKPYPGQAGSGLHVHISLWRVRPPPMPRHLPAPQLRAGAQGQRRARPTVTAGCTLLVPFLPRPRYPSTS
jgi:hypothetical protein